MKKWNFIICVPVGTFVCYRKVSQLQSCLYFRKALYFPKQVKPDEDHLQVWCIF